MAAIKTKLLEQIKGLSQKGTEDYAGLKDKIARQTSKHMKGEMSDSAMQIIQDILSGAEADTLDGLKLRIERLKQLRSQIYQAGLGKKEQAILVRTANTAEKALQKHYTHKNSKTEKISKVIDSLSNNLGNNLITASGGNDVMKLLVKSGGLVRSMMNNRKAANDKIQGSLKKDTERMYASSFGKGKSSGSRSSDSAPRGSLRMSSSSGAAVNGGDLSAIVAPLNTISKQLNSLPKIANHVAKIASMMDKKMRDDRASAADKAMDDLEASRELAKALKGGAGGSKSKNPGDMPMPDGDGGGGWMSMLAEAGMDYLMLSSMGGGGGKGGRGKGKKGKPNAVQRGVNKIKKTGRKAGKAARNFGRSKLGKGAMIAGALAAGASLFSLDGKGEPIPIDTDGDGINDATKEDDGWGFSPANIVGAGLLGAGGIGAYNMYKNRNAPKGKAPKGKAPRGRAPRGGRGNKLGNILGMGMAALGLGGAAAGAASGESTALESAYDATTTAGMAADVVGSGAKGAAKGGSKLAKGASMLGKAGKFLGPAGVLLGGALDYSDRKAEGQTTGQAVAGAAGSTVGGGLGMWGGAAAGAALGSVVPVVGTAIGGLIGGALGMFGGSWLGGKAADTVTGAGSTQPISEMIPTSTELEKIKTREEFDKKYAPLREKDVGLYNDALMEWEMIQKASGNSAGVYGISDDARKDLAGKMTGAISGESKPTGVGAVGSLSGDSNKKSSGGILSKAAKFGAFGPAGMALGALSGGKGLLSKAGGALGTAAKFGAFGPLGMVLGGLFGGSAKKNDAVVASGETPSVSPLDNLLQSDGEKLGWRQGKFEKGKADGLTSTAIGAKLGGSSATISKKKSSGGLLSTLAKAGVFGPTGMLLGSLMENKDLLSKAGGAVGGAAKAGAFGPIGMLVASLFGKKKDPGKENKEKKDERKDTAKEHAIELGKVLGGNGAGGAAGVSSKNSPLSVLGEGIKKMMGWFGFGDKKDTSTTDATKKDQNLAKMLAEGQLTALVPIAAFGGNLDLRQILNAGEDDLGIIVPLRSLRNFSSNTGGSGSSGGSSGSGGPSGGSVSNNASGGGSRGGMDASMGGNAITRGGGVGSGGGLAPSGRGGSLGSMGGGVGSGGATVPEQGIPGVSTGGGGLASAAANLKGMSTREGPGGGRVSCVYAVNKVFASAGMKPPWGGALSVKEAEAAMQREGWQQVPPGQHQPGDVWVAPSPGSHIGIVTPSGNVLSNSSSKASFTWEAPVEKVAGYYNKGRGGLGRFYRPPQGAGGAGGAAGGGGGASAIPQSGLVSPDSMGSGGGGGSQVAMAGTAPSGDLMPGASGSGGAMAASLGGGMPPGTPPGAKSSSGGGAATPFKGGQKDFYDNLYQTLYKEAEKAGVKNPEAVARLGAAQSSLETGYGKHTAGGNNYFGIKDFSGKNKGQATKEFINGKMVTVKDSFRSYNSMEESAADYIKFLQTNKRYKGVLNANSTEEAIAAQAASGYATDPEYGAKLTKINARGSAGTLPGGAPGASPAGPGIIPPENIQNPQIQLASMNQSQAPKAYSTVMNKSSTMAAQPPMVNVNNNNVQQGGSGRGGQTPQKPQSEPTVGTSSRRPSYLAAIRA